jgi:uncharacterized protein YjbI with pentapeptide repeats
MIIKIQLEEVLNRFHSTSKRTALEALEILRERGWLTDGSLQGTAMCRAVLHGANLYNANLCCGRLHQADPQWANLSRVNFRGAKLSLGNLSGSKV